MKRNRQRIETLAVHSAVNANLSMSNELEQYAVDDEILDNLEEELAFELLALDKISDIKRDNNN